MVGSPQHAQHTHRAHDLVESRSDQLRRERVATGVVIMLALLIGIAISAGAMLVIMNP
ncbi:MAG: hypothetical protein JWM74_2922 [Myxococcaceae bacterium]|nr:hypothetical protein [Myxococcaceae bacterium]